jgi:uncharacterized protein
MAHVIRLPRLLADAPRPSVKVPLARITLPEGTIVNSEQPDVHRTLSNVLKVTLCAVSDRPAATAEEYWPDIEGLDHRDAVTEFGLPGGTFFDCAFVHLLTTATLDQLRLLYPQGRFEVRRFRPNIVVETASGEKEFAENGWIGQIVGIGGAVRLSITGPCARCVMTTLAQGDLPKDAGILRTAPSATTLMLGCMPLCCRVARFAVVIPSRWSSPRLAPVAVNNP